MKYATLFAVAMLAAASHGGWLDSALKSVDNATQKASDVNNALQGSAAQPAPAPAAQPAPAPAAQPAPAPAAQQPLSYQEKVKAVNDGLQVASAKMPLRDHYQEMYNAAYEFSNIDRQFSFLPPEQRATRTSPEKMKLVDEFLAWIEGGAVIAQGAAQPPSGAPAVPSGYGQAPSYANAPTTAPSAPTAAEGGTNGDELSFEEAQASFNELDKMLSDAQREGCEIDRHKIPRWMVHCSAFRSNCTKKDLPGRKAEIEALIAEGNGNKEETLKFFQTKIDELGKITTDINAAVAKYSADLENCKKAVKEYYDRYQEYLSERDAGFDPHCQIKHTIESFLIENGDDMDKSREESAKSGRGGMDKSSGGSAKSGKTAEDYFAEYKYKRNSSGPEGAEMYKNSVLKLEIEKAQETLETLQKAMASNGAANTGADVSFPELKTELEKQISEMGDKAVSKILNGDKGLDAKLQVAYEQKKISVEFLNKMRDEKNTIGGSPEKALALLKKVDDEIAAREKAEQEVAALVKKLAGLDVSAWIAELEGRPQGEDFDKLVNAALKAKFGLEAPAKAQLGGVRKLVSKFYTKEQQLKIVKTEGIGPLGVFLAIISVADDAEFRKTLLVDNTDWAFLCLRRDFDSDDLDSDIGQYAYVTLLAQEKNLDVLVAIYEKQDRWNFKYTPNAPKSDGTPGAELEKMMKQYKDFNGDGYGRLGEWMLDSCGKEFGKRVSKLADARRKVAKDQMFMINDFYLGMPHRDARLVMRGWDEKKNGHVWMSFGSFNNGTLSEINFNGKARTEYLGVKKDGLKGIGQFVEKYIPGGLNSVDDLKVGGEADVGHDPANPQVTVTTWWYTNCHKYDCRIRAYDSGTICVLNTSSDDYPKLDFSKVK